MRVPWKAVECGEENGNDLAILTFLRISVPAGLQFANRRLWACLSKTSLKY